MHDSEFCDISYIYIRLNLTEFEWLSHHWRYKLHVHKSHSEQQKNINESCEFSALIYIFINYNVRVIYLDEPIPTKNAFRAIEPE